MRMEELWWNRLINSVRFLDDMQDILREERSVLVCFETEIPWKEVLFETLEDRLSAMTDSRKFERMDVSKETDPGRFLLQNFCNTKQREDYWPTKHKKPEYFLAQYRDTTIHKRFVCLTGIAPAAAESWKATAERYLSRCTGEHGIFILIVEGKLPRQPEPEKSEKAAEPPERLATLHYADYVSDYDCMMLCLTMISDLSCSRGEKMYLCEVASNIAHNHVELAGLLAEQKEALIRDPYTTAETVFAAQHIKVTNLHERIRMAVWEAQIKLVFPKLESFRAEIIRKYEGKLQQYLPIRSSNNDQIDKAADLEIGQLFYICKENRARKITDVSEYEMLRKMRDARNTLAHWDSLTYEQLKELRIL